MQRSISLTAKRLFVHWNLQGIGNPPTVPSFFNLCGSGCWERSFASASGDYREILRNRLSDIIKVDDAVDLFGDMVKSRPFPSIVEFNKLLSAVAKMNKFELVISLGEQMQTLGISHGSLYPSPVEVDEEDAIISRKRRNLRPVRFGGFSGLEGKLLEDPIKGFTFIQSFH